MSEITNFVTMQSCSFSLPEALPPSQIVQERSGYNKISVQETWLVIKHQNRPTSRIRRRWCFARISLPGQSAQSSACADDGLVEAICSMYTRWFPQCLTSLNFDMMIVVPALFA
jgi:hypothetical protein